mmetsp:Transcript_130381/g.239779  ORF Transcript_130381/g.239779 Transcript_130381/m.239779 type:complete len:134 (+) Transcript_130381:198-599(+)
MQESQPAHLRVNGTILTSQLRNKHIEDENDAQHQEDEQKSQDQRLAAHALCPLFHVQAKASLQQRSGSDKDALEIIDVMFHNADCAAERRDEAGQSEEAESSLPQHSPAHEQESQHGQHQCRQIHENSKKKKH